MFDKKIFDYGKGDCVQENGLALIVCTDKFSFFNPSLLIVKNVIHF